MDVFALLFIVSFLALVITLAVMHIRKCMNKGNGNIGRRKTYGFIKDKAARISLNTQKVYTRSYDLESSMMKREVNETQEKWKETLPKHSTRIKLRNSRKLRNKRKGKK